MTQFEFDTLSIMANGWRLIASTKPEPEAKVYFRLADEVTEWLRHADTIPPEPPAVTTPAPPPSAE